MNLAKANYIPRLIDQKLEKYLEIFGAVSIEGPKWCGKTWTGLEFAKDVAYLTEKSTRNLADADPKYIFSDQRPQLIDEWQISPGIWDAVRHECDASDRLGNFILTGSTSLEKRVSEESVFHSGTGRIATLRMSPMSLYESGDSSGQVSLSGLLEGDFAPKNLGQTELPDLANLLLRGGWPGSLRLSKDSAPEISKSYIESVVTKDIHERSDRKRNPNKMRMLLRALARNESSLAGDDTLVKDIEVYESEGELIESRQTVSDYLGVLDSLYLLANQPAFSVNYRSSGRIGKSPKRHLVDPSLSCALLDLSVEKLMNDLNTFGLMFEALVERDLRIFADLLDAKLYHFRDNSSGDEVDAIFEFRDGRYAAIEIKLTDGAINEAIASLEKFSKNVVKKPAFSLIIVGHLAATYRDSDSGIYLAPATSLKP